MKSTSEKDEPISLTSTTWLRAILWWLVDTCVYIQFMASSWACGKAALQNWQGYASC